MATPESKVQSKIIKHLELDGYFVVKLMATNKNGIPDLLAVKTGSLNLWIEVKTVDGKLSKLQSHRHNELQKVGQAVLVPFGYEDFVFLYSYVIKNIENGS